MTPTVVLPVIIGGLYAAGVYLLLDRSLTRVLVGFLLLGNATNLLLLSTGGPAGLAPILGYAEPEEMSDPLPQALILTAIVITFGVTAFVLAMIHRSWALARNEAVGTDEEDRRVAGRHDTDADELDPDDLAPEDRPAGHADSLSERRLHGDGRDPDAPGAEELADDIDLPLGGGPMISVLAPLPVLLPLLGAAGALLVGRHPRTQRALSLLVLTAVLAVSVALLLQADAQGSTAVSVGGWPVPLGIVLVVDRLSALMLVVASTVALGVLVFAVGQGSADGSEETPLSIFHPTFLVLIAGVSNAFLAGDLFNLYVGFEILLMASYVLLTLGGSAPRVRAGITYVVVSLHQLADLPGGHRADLRVDRHRQHGAAGDPAGRAARGHPAAAAVDAADRLLDQGGGLPALGLAARQLPDRAGAGDRGVRRPAHQGRRLRDHPHPDAAVPLRCAGRPAHVGGPGHDGDGHPRCGGADRHPPDAVVHPGQPHRLHGVRHRPGDGGRAGRRDLLRRPPHRHPDHALPGRRAGGAPGRLDRRWTASAGWPSGRRCWRCCSSCRR